MRPLREHVGRLARLGGWGEARPPHLKDLREALARFVYGLTGYEFARHAVEMRHQLEAVFMVVTFGDLVGVPILPPIYSLRLLPHVVPEVATWKRHLARRKEFWEKEEYDLHGI
jgi:hypothetical protein